MANLFVPDVEWWVMACGGATYCIPKVGLYMICFARKAKHIVLEDPDVCECIYLKYMHNVEGLGLVPCLRFSCEKAAMMPNFSPTSEIGIKAVQNHKPQILPVCSFPS